MQAQLINTRASEQRPKLERSKLTPKYIINGCTVSFTSATRATEEQIKVIKEILLSAYKTKIAKS